MDRSEPTPAQQIARAASAFERDRTGHAPRSVTVVLGEDTLVITLHGALSPAEQALASSPEGAAQLQELHRQLFHSSAEALRQEIYRITGVPVRESAVAAEPAGGVAHAFPTGAVVQVFLLAGSLPPEAWSGSGPGEPGCGRPGTD